MRRAMMLLAIASIVFAAHAQPRGDAADGRATFAKLRCNACHSVYRENDVAKPAPHPLRDLSKETPETVANLIVTRTQLDPHSMFDEQAMSIAASGMTRKDLADLVAYLRMMR